MPGELLANSPIAGVREPIGELSAELALGATGVKALKLAATIAKATGLREAGCSSRVLIAAGPNLQAEIVRFNTAEGTPTEYDIIERAAEESTEKAWPVGSKVYALPTRGGLDARFATVLDTVRLTGSQTITGKKTFTGSEAAGNIPLVCEPPTPVEEVATLGSVGTAACTITSGAGGATRESGLNVIVTGGAGGPLTISSGAGGKAKGEGSAEEATGGIGGLGTLKGGKGGAAEGQANIETLRGGQGGYTSLVGGEGGVPTATGTGIRIGGAGGNVVHTGGKGAEAVVGTGTRTGGDGGGIEATGGVGGSGSTAGGVGGACKFKGGAAGSGGTPKGGEVRFTGGPASTAALSGSIVFFTGTGTGTERVSIGGEGLTTIKNGLTVEGTLKLAAAAGPPLEILAATTYEVPKNVQELWKANISIQGTLNVQGQFLEVA